MGAYGPRQRNIRGRVALDVSIWHNRDFALLLGGTTVNEVGDWLLELALPVYVFIETGSGISTAAVYIVRLMVEVLCGPLGGSWADRWRLRSTLVTTNLLHAAALGPLLLVSSDRIWPVYLVVALQGMISSVKPRTINLVPSRGPVMRLNNFIAVACCV